MCWRLLIFVGLTQILSLHGLSSAEKAPNYSFLKDATKSPPVLTSQYIIIGGGTSGCALAATLSQESSVLVLERGGVPYTNPNIVSMAKFPVNLGDIRPNSPTQQFISEDGVINHRARVLGGGSALNAGFYTRAESFFVKEMGWDQTLVEESYEWVEKKVAFKPNVKQWQSAVKNGLIEVGVVPNNGFTYDHTYGTKVGGSIFDEEGHRHTAADLLEYADPGKITVLLHATVVKILFRTNGKQKPRAYGVIYEDALGIKHTAYLAKESRCEIILSAGALGSPQILMLSGIGPADHLRAHGLQVVMDQPMVGQGMADNPMNVIFVPSPRPIEVSLIQVVGITNFNTYIEAASGLSLIPSVSQELLRNIASNQANQTEDIAKAMDAMKIALNTNTNVGVILEKVARPISRGHLELLTTNPHDNPSVTFNYFQAPEDLKSCVDGMNTIVKVLESSAFSGFRYKMVSVQALLGLTATVPFNLRPKHLRDAFDMEQFCKDTVVTIWHFHGGCQVGKVVDKDYRVFGVDALRVIDGSTWIHSPGTNPQATVMMLGRYMGQRIMQERAQHWRK
ncbi:Glucose-methanol-choline oxidoreductase, N-terminal [Dillenia turbinata]|uniref:Glucose-methanol-choline oxidoreductase, N-terminal n=1 Tax=Dillenia turbinata TaxID=194707 RepID=A0AAN8VA28_9MAGN